ncbi:MAG TPA: acetolactate synthase large subunit [Candidatus Aquilonibacter sp.]|nr:acetolactate synthase large subunit [Candidatus Aquilonibacter sp.]
MNGAESLVRTLVAADIKTCFTNPGTSEMHIVAALDREEDLRCVLCLFEGVATGAADGYARMAEKPACTLLHLGPGLANGTANLHNASRARVPLLSIVGEHPSYHLRYDAPLNSDIEAIARPYSKWLRTSRAASELGRDCMEAAVAARTEPGQIATLVVPADAAWGEGGCVAAVASWPDAPAAPTANIEKAAAILRSGARVAILLAGKALYGEALTNAGKIAAATSARLFAPYPFTRLRQGTGLPVVERVAYIREQAAEQFKEFQHLLLIGADVPITYFASQGKSSEVVPQSCEIHTVALSNEDCPGALAALAGALGVKIGSAAEDRRECSQKPTGAISLSGIAVAIAATLPEEAIVADESMTSGRAILPATRACSPHDWLACTGGSIGIAMPLAVGAAVASPERRVLCLTADGSGMYTAQALWTMARENLNVTTVIFANRAYGVLKREFLNLGIGTYGPRAQALFEIGRPDIDWVSLAKALGVPGKRVTSLDELSDSLQDSHRSEGPSLIEIPL